MYYKDKHIQSEFDYSDDSLFDVVQAEAVKKTYEMKNTHVAYGYDVFDAAGLGYVLLAHDKETYDHTKEWAQEYAKENKCKLAYFVGWYDAVIV